MAQQTFTQLTDDLDGTEATETVEFALDGVTYTIDLSAENALSLRDALAVYVGHARKVSGRSKVKAKQNGSNGATPVDLAAVRAWARENGFQVSDRGRVSSEVRAAYEAAH